MDINPGSPGTAAGIDPERIRLDFPMLAAEVNGKPLVYLDNAASTQKPRVVIERLCRFYSDEFAKNDEEHALSQVATANMSRARASMAELLHAPDAASVTIAQNATDALHIIAGGSRAPCCGRATRSCSRCWSTTRTSFPGSRPAGPPEQGSAWLR